jgi:peptidyl-tRNA hydrolase, PTH2 family
MNYEPKQVIVIRKDLNMRKGKMVAQGAHASMKVILDKMSKMVDEWKLNLDEGSSIQKWLEGKFTKICVSVDSEAELIEIYDRARSNGIICSIITDAGLTEFDGIPTKTAVAIGPAWPEEIDPITSHLKLL